MGVAALISTLSADGKRSGHPSATRRIVDIRSYNNFIDMNPV
jgi:hypothetical protein